MLADRLSFGVEEQVEVAFIGRLHRSAAYTEPKNVALLIEAVRWMREAGGGAVPVRVHVVADGNASEAALAALRGTGVTVVHHRNLDRPWDAIPTQAVVVAPSRHEGFSLVVAEAQWHGRRVLISAAIPEEAVFVPELVRRMPAGAGAQAWGEAILALAGTKEVVLRHPVRLADACTRRGHIALLAEVHGKAAACGC